MIYQYYSALISNLPNFPLFFLLFPISRRNSLTRNGNFHSNCFFDAQYDRFGQKLCCSVSTHRVNFARNILPTRCNQVLDLVESTVHFVYRKVATVLRKRSYLVTAQSILVRLPVKHLKTKARFH